MKKIKTGLSLIILGNFLYLASTVFNRNEASDLSNFTSGLLIGLSIGCNLIGIILTASYLAEENEKSKNNTKVKNNKKSKSNK